jgi:uncharacterized protein
MTTNFPPGTPNWVDLGTTDVNGAAAFYGQLFGWTLEDLGPDAGGYGIFYKDGKQVAGVGPATDPDRGTSWAIYFATDDADTTAARVEKNGGKVIMAPMDVMDQGRMAVFQDPTGAYFSVWQPGQHKGAELVDAPGAMYWAELMTTDVASAAAFYNAVFGMSIREVDMGGGMMYTLLKVGDANVAGLMAPGPGEGSAPAHWAVYFAAEDTDATADHAVQLGGSETVRDDSPAGRFAWLIDPQGGKFCVIKPDPDFAP